jgi:hypothetical protein
MSVTISDPIYYILYIGWKFNTVIQVRKVIDIMNRLISNLAIIG